MYLDSLKTLYIDRLLAFLFSPLHSSKNFFFPTLTTTVEFIDRIANRMVNTVKDLTPEKKIKKKTRLYLHATRHINKAFFILKSSLLYEIQFSHQSAGIL